MHTRSIVVAALILLAAVLWIGTGPGFVSRSPGTTADKNPPSASPEPVLIRVRVADSEHKPYRSTLIVRGVTRPSRSVALRSEVKGRVVKLLARKGELVDTGQVVVRLDPAARRAALREAQARVAQARLEHQAITELSKKGYRAEANVAAAKAALESALSLRDRIQRDIANTSPRAPYRGVLTERKVELGDYVMEGQALATITDLDPILAEGHVTERERARVRLGAPAQIRLLDGRIRKGTVHFVSTVADPATRTFPIEVEIDNPDLDLAAGLTAELRIESSTTPAHLVPASVLTLDEAGTLGVKLLDAADTIRFVPVKPLGQAKRGLWVGGLDAKVRVVVVGGDYVGAGTRVTPDDAGPLHLILNQ